MTIRYGIICEKRGVLLGVKYEDDTRAYFADFEGSLGVTKATSFGSLENAQEFAYVNLYSEDFGDFMYPSFDVDDNFISCLDFIDAGLGDHTGDMFWNLENRCETEQ